MMLRAIVATFALALALVARAQDKPIDRGQTFVVISLPALAKADEPALKAAIEGTGVQKIDVDLAKKTARVVYDTQRTRSADILARVAKREKFAAAQIDRLGATLKADWATMNASATVKKDGKGSSGAVAIEVESKDESSDTAVSAHFPAGFKVEKPRRGKSDEETVFDFHADEFAGGEIAVELEVKLLARSDARGTSPKRTAILVVPVVIP